MIEKRPRSTRCNIYYGAVILIAGIIVGVVIAAALATIIPNAVREAPIEIDIRPATNAGQVCPGDLVEQIATSNAAQLVKAQLDVTFEHDDDTGAIPASLSNSLIYHIAPGRQENKTTWIVPELPPGRYFRTVGIHLLGRDTLPFVERRPFTIAPECFTVQPPDSLGHEGEFIPAPAVPGDAGADGRRITPGP